MKAQRRQELRNNTLAEVLHNLPLYLRFHANKFLIGVIVVCLVILLVRYRLNASRQLVESVRTSLDSARVSIDQLRSIDRSQFTDMARIQERKNVAIKASTDLDRILDNTSDSDDIGLRSSAWVARGDLYWTLANLPALPGAATQPSLAMPQTTDEYLKEAEDAYQNALTRYDSQKIAKAASLMGLAAIEENRSHWDKAADYYKAVTSDAKMAQIFKLIAEQRQNLIPQISKPTFIGSFSSTQPATAPSAEPTTMESVMAPATQDSAPGPTIRPSSSTNPQ